MAGRRSAKADIDTAERSRGFGAILVFEQLRDQILSMELRPGQLIDEVNLASRFNVSRSPVREALVRLAAERLVQTVPNKGTMVTPLNLDEFPAYVDALDLIQRAVFRLAARFRTEDDLTLIRSANEEFRRRVTANDALGMIRQNAKLHLAMAAAGRNRILTDTYRRILDEGRRTLRLYFRSYGDTLPESLCDAHDEQIAAIAAQDEARAEQLAREHADEVHQRFLRYMSERSSLDLTVAFENRG